MGPPLELPAEVALEVRVSDLMESEEPQLVDTSATAARNKAKTVSVRFIQGKLLREISIGMLSVRRYGGKERGCRYDGHRRPSAANFESAPSRMSTGCNAHK